MRLHQLSDCSCQEGSSNEYANYNHGSAYAIPRYTHVRASINMKLYSQRIFSGYYKFDGIQQ